MQPLVSILIPCYNAGPWIAQCIRSALDQTYANKEVVVVDDGSRDNSLEVIRSFGDRIRYEAGPNRGGNAARNRLLQLSAGEWLEFLDADDFLLPQKIEKQIAMLGAQPALDVIYSPVLHQYGEVALEQLSRVEDDDLYANYFRWAYFSTTVLLLRKAAVIEVGGWKEDQRVCQEHELMLRLILAGKSFGLMREALGVNRVESNESVSRRSPLVTLRQKMALSDQLEAHLLVRGEMTELRRVALSQARFRAARAAYAWEKTWARSLCAKALATGPFVPPTSVNPYFIYCFRAFGFDVAERLASVHRKFFGVTLDNPSPMGSGTFRKVASNLNSGVGALGLRVLPESKSLITLVFHAVVDEAEGPRCGSLNPRYVISVGQFECCVNYYLKHGFEAVSPLDILRGLSPEKRYVMFTFDDGYANNLKVLPILERHRVPATFALITDCVLLNRPFWWDVVYEKRNLRGDDPGSICREVDALVHENSSIIERRLVDRYGPEVLSPSTERNRPMRPDEVRELAKHPLVFWANHSARHEFLPDCQPDDIRRTVGQAQEALRDLTGSPSVAMVYPYGANNEIVRRICWDMGLRLGFTMGSVKYPLELNGTADGAMAIPRFGIYPDRDMEAQCLETRIDWKPSWLLWGRPAYRP
jgi:glycosyltransferase involved in cell wall biosynthesis/peptidoglycan/xylan/chitin deacetylase (PgdA/CDA1 family)